VPVSPQTRIAIVEQERRSIEQRLVTAEEAFAPASVEQISVHLVTLAELYRRELSETTINVYIDVLREQPASVLDAAVRQHVSVSKWFPTPAELLDLCKELRWPLEVELENARAEVQWSKDPAFGRTAVQLMAECRVMYGQYASALDTEWMILHLGSAPPVPEPTAPLSVDARAAIETRVRAERNAEQQRLAAVLEEGKRITERERLPKMPFDCWSRERRGVEAVSATLNRWCAPEPEKEER
jgi:hypothetical protein